MSILNIIIALLSFSFIYRGTMLVIKMKKENMVKECIIGLAIVLAYTLGCAKILLSFVSRDTVYSEPLINYYLYLGCIVLQMLAAHFIINHLYDKK